MSIEEDIQYIEENEDKTVRVDLLDVLLDENNTAPIYMYDATGRQLKFEQVAIIPYKKKYIYVILKPLVEIEGVSDDEAIVFKLDYDNSDESYLRIEENKRIANKVFKKYSNLIEKELRKKKK